MKQLKKYYVIDDNYDTTISEFNSKKGVLNFIKEEIRRDSNLDFRQMKVVKGYEISLIIKEGLVFKDED